MKKSIIIAVGGTGGHIYPAIAVAEEIIKSRPEIDILFAGGGLTKNPYFKNAPFACIDVSSGTLSLRKPVASLINAGRIVKGIAESYQLIKKLKPNILLGFGSYHSFPVLFAARAVGIPYILHEQNSVLGRVNRYLAPRAIFTGYFFPDIRKQTKGKVLDVGMPLRQSCRKGSCNINDAKQYFEINQGKQTIMIFGGSQGAKALNHEFAKKIATASRKDFSILHFTGSTAATEELRKHYEKHRIEACVKDFETRMDLAWQAADLLIARSGAGTVAEQIEFEVPGILVPYPYAKDNHQETNADFMVHTVGGAAKLLETEFGKRNLLEEALAMISAENLMKKKQAISNYKQEHHSHDFCSLILKQTEL